MKFSVFSINKLKNQKGFSLLEILIVISISSLILIIFLELNLKLYQNNNFFNLENSWQQDLYLAIDFLSSQIKNSLRTEVLNKNELDIFTYYDGDYQWLKFSLYENKRGKNLARAIGSKNINNKDFGRNLSLVNDIENINFKIIGTGLMQISISVKANNKNLKVEKLINIVQK